MGKKKIMLLETEEALLGR